MAGGAWQSTATVAAVLLNINRDPKKHPPVKPDDLNPFIPEKLIDPAIETQIGFDILRGAFRDAKVLRVKARHKIAEQT